MTDTEKQILSRRVLEMEESQTLGMAKKGRELKAKGIDVISLNLGEPDFQTPDHIKEAAKRALDEGFTFYPPVSGYPELREAIADKLRRENSIPAKAENIVVSTGAKQSIANVMLSLLNPGDEVIIFSPYWVSYAGIVQLAEGTPVFLKGDIENDYKASADRLRSVITERTKAVIYSSPCNPTGAVFSEEELRAIADVVAEYPDIYVIADEIYELINFTGTHFSIGSVEKIQDRVITVNGFSKGYAMTGWRLGYICAPVNIAKACDKIQGQVTSGANSIAQRAGIAAISGTSEPGKEMAEAYLRRRSLIKELLDDIPGVKTNLPQGAFYIFPDVSAYFGKSFNGHTLNTTSDIAMYLLNEGHVSVVMGEAFGSEECIRISYAAADDVIREGLRRMKEAFAKLS